ncbi:carbohydrate sulfotransferase 11-like [Anneissia japonica]|uniref:carbohydrate sulfotransferase 11-like n=1 Tax=Anneissia japonica TaxID=1529436 RepID=UPI0014254DA8|nr:carbohydrate sulfotransferase 11-like [Anneissia japonica]
MLQATKPGVLVLIISFFLCLFVALSPHLSKFWLLNEEDKRGILKKNSQQRPPLKIFSNSGTNNVKSKDNQTNGIIPLEEEQKARLSTLQTACTVTKHKSKFDVVLNPPNNLYVDCEHKLLYCSIPKIASTNWKRVLLVLAGKMKTIHSENQLYVNRIGSRQLKRFRDLKLPDRQAVMYTYIKFLFVRHPFSRVLSVFRNKLEPNSTFERAHAWQKRLGRFIIRKYRQHNKQQSQQNVEHKYDLTFGEFIKYIIDRNMNSENGHWREMYQMCFPCDIPYTFIGKFETLTTDAQHLLAVANANKKVQFPPSSASSPTNSSNDTIFNEYFKDIPRQDIEALYKRYQLDFRLFGYHLDERF